MNYNDIEKKASNLKGVINLNEEEINKNIIEVLNMCILKNIRLDLSEREFVKIINIYFDLGFKDISFLKSLVELNNEEFDFVKIINLWENKFLL